MQNLAYHRQSEGQRQEFDPPARVGNERAATVTYRLYLQAVAVHPGPAQPGDLQAERVFIHASSVPEVWVETEITRALPAGKAVSFVLARPMHLGFERITGTVERSIRKQHPH